MIDYTPLWNTMKEKDISQYDLLNHGIDKRTLQRLRTDQNITALTIEKLCQILHCIYHIFFPIACWNICFTTAVGVQKFPLLRISSAEYNISV